jgi:hypothetical protein
MTTAERAAIKPRCPQNPDLPGVLISPRLYLPGALSPRCLISRAYISRAYISRAYISTVPLTQVTTLPPTQTWPSSPEEMRTRPRRPMAVPWLAT